MTLSLARTQPTTITTATPALDVSMLAGQVAASTMAMYKRDAAAYAAFAGSREAAYQPATLARWRASLAQATSHSPNTINRMLSAVKRIVREAAAQGHVPQAIADGFDNVSGVKAKALKDRLKPQARTRISPADMRRICETPDVSTLTGLRDKALLLTLASSGCRISEVITLTAGQVQRKGRGFVLSVTGKNDTEAREAPLSPEAWLAIQTWLAARPLAAAHIFTAMQGRSQVATSQTISAVGAWKAVQKYAEAAGLAHVKPHDFRRFVGTQLAKNDIRKAQKALGHKRIDTTAKHYVLDELEPGMTDKLF